MSSAARQREWRQRRYSERVPGVNGKPFHPDAPHGRFTAYVNFGCRCQDCADANTRVQHRYRKMRKEGML
ncbi:hypothetical protein [Rhodococcus sp. 11-3]|uniref:hypothetical protein n=1 Tax=Rhodococcus sp. 11-3 TaxID=2854796 RepID=UPI002041C132|nr:hypothetical protein [Rhodococcus sp. 11-3]USC16997.1 hypothetical protein KZJ41_09085 [Rhodococcus sp. 11-3]